MKKKCVSCFWLIFDQILNVMARIDFFFSFLVSNSWLKKAWLMIVKINRAELIGVKFLLKKEY